MINSFSLLDLALININPWSFLAPMRTSHSKGVPRGKNQKKFKSLNGHNSVTIGPTELADPSLESSIHALSDGPCVVCVERADDVQSTSSDAPRVKASPFQHRGDYCY